MASVSDTLPAIAPSYPPIPASLQPKNGLPYAEPGSIKSLLINAGVNQNLVGAARPPTIAQTLGLPSAEASGNAPTPTVSPVQTGQDLLGIGALPRGASVAANTQPITPTVSGTGIYASDKTLDSKDVTPAAKTLPGAAPVAATVQTSSVAPSYADQTLSNALDYIKGGADQFEQASRARSLGHILPSIAAPTISNQGASAVESQRAESAQKVATINAGALSKQGRVQQVGSIVNPDEKTRPFAPLIPQFGTVEAPGEEKLTVTPLTKGSNSPVATASAPSVGMTYGGGDGIHTTAGGAKITVQNGRVTKVE